jgi:hypothetical protein
VGNSLLVGKMQNDVDLAERYRKEANKFAGLARSALPGVFRDVFLVPAYWQLIGSLTRVVALVAVFVAGRIPVELRGSRNAPQWSMNRRHRRSGTSPGGCAQSRAKLSAHALRTPPSSSTMAARSSWAPVQSPDKLSWAISAIKVGGG